MMASAFPAQVVKSRAFFGFAWLKRGDRFRRVGREGIQLGRAEVLAVLRQQGGLRLLADGSSFIAGRIGHRVLRRRGVTVLLRGRYRLHDGGEQAGLSGIGWSTGFEVGSSR